MIRTNKNRLYNLRKNMVEHQLQLRGIKSSSVLTAFLNVHREDFVIDKFYDNAYDDRPLPLISGQTISQPYIVALMTEMLELPNDKPQTVLEVGTGSGYQAAILTSMGHNVVTVERLDELMEMAKNNLKQMNLSSHIKLCLGDGCLGWVDDAPFDAIIVTAPSPIIPKDLIVQMKVGAKIVIPYGNPETQKLIQGVKQNDGTLRIINKGKCSLMPAKHNEYFK